MHVMLDLFQRSNTHTKEATQFKPMARNVLRNVQYHTVVNGTLEIDQLYWGKNDD